MGRAKAREQLEIFIGAAKKRGEALDHVLLWPAGAGQGHCQPRRCRLSCGVNLRARPVAQVLEKPRGSGGAADQPEEANDVLFIDEIHRLSPASEVEEIFVPRAGSFQIDIMIGEGPAARSVELDLQPFTLVATTRAGMLTNPLRDRFAVVGAA